MSDMLNTIDTPVTNIRDIHTFGVSDDGNYFTIEVETDSGVRDHLKFSMKDVLALGHGAFLALTTSKKLQTPAPVTRPALPAAQWDISLDAQSQSVVFQFESRIGAAFPFIIARDQAPAMIQALESMGAR